MTVDDPDRQAAAEARLIEAREQLRAAEAAYREVVPCPHATLRISSDGDGDTFHCADCDVDLADLRACRHRHIDNATRQCSACGERMLELRRTVQTVLSAPNAAACTNPQCSGDISDPNCGNPSGIYVPDVALQREVPVREDYTYTCRRCANPGIAFVSGRWEWDCGRDHRGDSRPIRAAC